MIIGEKRCFLTPSDTREEKSLTTSPLKAIDQDVASFVRTFCSKVFRRMLLKMITDQHGCAAWKGTKMPRVSRLVHLCTMGGFKKPDLASSTSKVSPAPAIPSRTRDNPGGMEDRAGQGLTPTRLCLTLTANT